MERDSHSFAKLSSFTTKSAKAAPSDIKSWKSEVCIEKAQRDFEQGHFHSAVFWYFKAIQSHTNTTESKSKLEEYRKHESCLSEEVQQLWGFRKVHSCLLFVI
jgi:hypothetical protein